MGIRIDKQTAERRLEEAIEWAKSGREVPDKWVELTERMELAPSKTYTPALGTALLAKATDPRIDALSIKQDYSDTTYSQRILCHGVLVPGAVRYGFSIRNTKREPLNNQPFFRYDHIEEIDRVRGQSLIFLDELRDGLRELDSYNESTAVAALAAFLRVRFKYLPELESFELTSEVHDISWLISRVEDFLEEEGDRPRRTQALVAAAFDAIYRNIKTRGLNDPSRDFPGDIQALAGKKPIMSTEVRAKLVPETEVRSFVGELRSARISRGFIVVIHPTHQALPRLDLSEWAWNKHHVVLTIIESAAELIRSVAAWSPISVGDVLNSFPVRVAERLIEIEATALSHGRWKELFVEV